MKTNFTSGKSCRRIITIDCDYIEPQFAAAYLLIDDGNTGKEAAFIDNNTTHSVPKLMKALKDEGLKPSDVRYVIITHVHLDHAGGTGALMKECSNATVLCHPRAEKHVVDPTKLVASAEHVYGKERFQKLYGQIFPVPKERVRPLEDGAVVSFGKGELRFIHTRGHAKHHFCIFDPQLKAVFTGDSFGLCYPVLQKNGPFIFPSTSPTDFEPKEALETLNKILALGATSAYPTHFGEMKNLNEAAKQLKEDILFSEELLEKVKVSPLKDEALNNFCLKELKTYFSKRLEKLELHKDPNVWRLLALDLEINAQGIAYAGGIAYKSKA